MALENYIIGASNTGAAGYHNAMAGMDQRNREAEADRHNAYIRQRDDQAYRDKMMREALEQASMAYSDEDGGETAYQGLANMSAQNGWPIPEKSFIVPVMKTLRGQYGDNLPSNVQEMQWIAQQGKFTPDEIAAQLRVEAGLKARAGQRLVRAPDGSVYLSDGSEGLTSLVTPQQAIEGAGLRAGTQQAAIEEAKTEAIPKRAPLAAKAEADKASAVEKAKNEEEKRVSYPKVQAAFRDGQQDHEDVLQEIEDAIALADKAAGYAAVGKYLPETDARVLANKIKSIQANIGFQFLSEMRQNSPTGGAVGNLTEREFDNLVATAGTLDQADKNLKSMLKRIKRNRIRAWNRVESAFKDDYKDYLQPVQPNESRPTPSVDELVNQYAPRP